MQLTNEVIVHRTKKEEYACFIPGYLRLKLKNFVEMDLEKLSATINATIIFTLFYDELAVFCPEIISYLS